MRRRHFICLLGGAAVWPTAAHAQIPAKRPLVAVLSGVTREGYARVSAFERGMRELGYVDGQNVDIEYRFADGWLERLPGLAEQLVRLSPNDHGCCHSGRCRGQSTDPDHPDCLPLACQSDRVWLDCERVTARGQCDGRLVPHRRSGWQASRTCEIG